MFAKDKRFNSALGLRGKTPTITIASIGWTEGADLMNVCSNPNMACLSICPHLHKCTRQYYSPTFALDEIQVDFAQYHE